MCRWIANGSRPAPRAWTVEEVRLLMAAAQEGNYPAMGASGLVGVGDSRRLG
ncbi:MAG: hypothetical protein U0836_20095 [Pirellulales bacterium]